MLASVHQHMAFVQKSVYEAASNIELLSDTSLQRDVFLLSRYRCGTVLLL